MDNALYIVFGLGLVAVLYAAVKAKGIVRRVGLLAFFRALSVLIAAFGVAFGKLIGGRDSGSVKSSPKPSNDGQAEDKDGHLNKAWDKVGAVSAPEQYVHHSDPEVSGLAQAHLDDD